jgi:hypothetical protein
MLYLVLGINGAESYLYHPMRDLVLMQMHNVNGNAQLTMRHVLQHSYPSECANHYFQAKDVGSR